MKKVLLVAALLCLWAAAPFSEMSAQCVPDPNITSPGIYPSSDTLPDGCEGTPYDEVVHFVFPPDTTVFGFTLDFDSFLVLSVNNVPNWATWQCDQFQNNCTYYTTPGQLLRGCVKIDGTPNAVFNDSVEVVGQAWVTVPFVGPTALNDTIRLNLRVHPSGNCPITSIDNSFASQLDLNVSPNPLTMDSKVSFNLPENAKVSAGIYDMYGREVVNLNDGNLRSGYHQFNLGRYHNLLSEGIYFLKFNANDGQYVTTRKMLAID